MAFEKWHPLKELEGMRREMDRIWGELLPSSKSMEPRWRGRAPGKEAVRPYIDIIDRFDEILIRAEMPGVKKEDIDISLEENILTIKGEIKNEVQANDGNYTCSERNYRSYLRSIDIPAKITADKITAALKDGILSVHLPKAAGVQPKKIKVEVLNGEVAPR